ncbi:hypothetical protein NKR23_g9765 [Pleurostoma richardsiae]|uniref:Uncharacterized protein n=1 Tax=Pleurostoma richardsiae TaxID=41990 RepID=A0AA38VC54_9PEZI|nr:hypothetical protein NKR23_g9765 [Pleurostoma richardsiae]
MARYENEGPPSFLFYVVSKIAGTYRPLAVVLRQYTGGPLYHLAQGHVVVDACWRIMQIFSHSANRAAIHAELALAADFYRRGNTPTSAALPISDPLRWGISELMRIRYGIVAFCILRVIQPPRQPPRRHTQSMTEYGPPFPEPQRQRKPLSAAEYMSKFDYRHPEPGALERIRRMPLVDETAFESIWPPDSMASQDSAPTLQHVHSSRPSLRDQAMGSLVRGILRSGEFDSALLEEPFKILGFRESLRRAVLDRAEEVTSSPAAVNILRIAFSGQASLNWTRLRGLATDTIDAALQLQELAESPSTQVFVALSARPDLLRGKKLYLSGAFSAPLRKEFWLPTAGFHLPFELFPVQHVFVRQQISRGETRPLRDSADPAAFWPSHLYLGDALLRPERFAVGFIRLLRRLASGLCHDNMEALCPFACAASSSSLRDNASVEISPLPAENLSIPVTAIQGSYTACRRLGCWPKLRCPVAGSWTVLVSHEQFIGQGEEATPSERAPLILKYAFVSAGSGLGVLVDDRLAELNGYWMQKLGAAATEWISVLSPEEAIYVLGWFFKDAEVVKGNLKTAMMENPEESRWYPELLYDEDSE